MLLIIIIIYIPSSSSSSSSSTTTYYTALGPPSSFMVCADPSNGVPHSLASTESSSFRPHSVSQPSQVRSVPTPDAARCHQLREYMRNINVYGRDGCIQRAIEKELLSEAGDLEQITSPATLGLWSGNNSDENLRRILDLCNNSSNNLVPLLSVSSRNPDLQVTNSNNSGGQDLQLKTQECPSLSQTLRHCTFQSVLLNSQRPGVDETVYQHAVTKSPSPDTVSQRILWHQWGSDLELGSPRVSHVVDLPSLTSKTTSDASVVPQGAPPSPTSSTFSSTLPQNQNNLSDVPEEVSGSEETSGSMSNLPNSRISQNSVSECLPSGSCANCNNLVTHLLLPKNANIFQNVNREANHCHKYKVLGFGTNQQMGSTSYICSSSEEKSLDAVNSEPPVQSRMLDCVAGNMNRHGDNNLLPSHPNHCSNSKASTARLTELTLNDLARYFHMPILEASKELNVGLTVLKKRCRIFGIPRWPHRKMKSLNSLINNIQDLAKEDSADDAIRVQSAVKELEKQRKEMEERPGIQLSEKTKRLRQACFKASYRKRRQEAVNDHNLTTSNIIDNVGNSTYRNSSNGNSSNNSSSSNSYHHYCL